MFYTFSTEDIEVATLTDIGDDNISENDFGYDFYIYELLILWFFVWLAFKLHAVFRTMFNNLRGGKHNV